MDDSLPFLEWVCFNNAPGNASCNHRKGSGKPLDLAFWFQCSHSHHIIHGREDTTCFHLNPARFYCYCARSSCICHAHRSAFERFRPGKIGRIAGIFSRKSRVWGFIKLVVLDPLTGGFKPLGEGKPIAWSPSGRFILASADDFTPASVVYDLRGRKTVEEILHPSSTEYTSYRNSTFWLPTGILPGPDDWLVIPDDHENGFEARGIPSGERHTLVPARNISDIDLSFEMLATTTGWLAWVPVSKSLTDIGCSSQTLSAVRVADPAKTHTWVLSEKIEKAYYTLLGAAPGASLLLLGASPAPTFGTDNVALYSFDLESGLLKDLGVTMLSNPSAYAWVPNPARRIGVGCRRRPFYRPQQAPGPAKCANWRTQISDKPGNSRL